MNRKNEFPLVLKSWVTLSLFMAVTDYKECPESSVLIIRSAFLLALKWTFNFAILLGIQKVTEIAWVPMFSSLSFP